ncbi:MAG TPA: hypothetical protein VFX57_02400 [Sulfuricurvum sp.]|nr:hypothetical protein [Sulfuricurvum sp.]
MVSFEQNMREIAAGWMLDLLFLRFENQSYCETPAWAFISFEFQCGLEMR